MSYALRRCIPFIPFSLFLFFSFFFFFAFLFRFNGIDSYAKRDGNILLRENKLHVSQMGNFTGERIKFMNLSIRCVSVSKVRGGWAEKLPYSTLIPARFEPMQEK